MKMTREDAIDCLVDYTGYFNRDEIGTPAMEFWIKDMMEMEIGCECFSDIDRHAWLNTLFGYDIGFDNAMKIEDWLWGGEIRPKQYRNMEALDMTINDKPLIQQCVKELNLNLSFNKWATKEPDVYRYDFN